MFRVYNPLKPTKYGIKSYICADSITAYCYKFVIYDGDYHSIDEIVNDLVTDLHGKNHRLHMDNYYNSVR